MNFDQETHALIAQAMARKTAGTQDDPYDLTGPAKVIVPVTTPLLNLLPQSPAASEEAYTLRATLRADAERIDAVVFAELLGGFKAAENHRILRVIGEWLTRRDAWNDPRLQSLALDLPDAEAISVLLGLGIHIGFSQDYHGWKVQHANGDVSYAVRRVAEVLFPA